MLTSRFLALTVLRVAIVLGATLVWAIPTPKPNLDPLDSCYENPQCVWDCRARGFQGATCKRGVCTCTAPIGGPA